MPQTSHCGNRGEGGQRWYSDNFPRLVDVQPQRSIGGGECGGRDQGGDEKGAAAAVCIVPPRNPVIVRIFIFNHSLQNSNAKFST